MKFSAVDVEKDDDYYRSRRESNYRLLRGRWGGPTLSTNSIDIDRDRRSGQRDDGNFSRDRMTRGNVMISVTVSYRSQLYKDVFLRLHLDRLFPEFVFFLEKLVGFRPTRMKYEDVDVGCLVALNEIEFPRAIIMAKRNGNRLFVSVDTYQPVTPINSFIKPRLMTKTAERAADVGSHEDLHLTFVASQNTVFRNYHLSEPIASTSTCEPSAPAAVVAADNDDNEKDDDSNELSKIGKRNDPTVCAHSNVKRGSRCESRDFYGNFPEREYCSPEEWDEESIKVHTGRPNSAKCRPSGDISERLRRLNVYKRKWCRPQASPISHSANLDLEFFPENFDHEPSREFTDYKLQVECLMELMKKVERGVETLLHRQDDGSQDVIEKQSSPLDFYKDANSLPILEPTNKKDFPVTSFSPEHQITDQPVVHLDVVCNNCHKDIVGVRYMCGNCANFDLCAVCEDTVVCHFHDHVFLKIRIPVCNSYQKDIMEPLLKNTLYEAEQFECTNQSEEKSDHFESVFPTPIELIMDAEFVDDETVPDGTKFHPLQNFTKSWSIVNTGSRPWSKDTSLKFLWGTTGFIPTHLEVPVPPLAPKQRGKISVDYVAPEKPGFYESHWNFVHNRHLFGHRIWCSIEVITPDAGIVIKIVKDNGVGGHKLEAVEHSAIAGTFGIPVNPLVDSSILGESKYQLLTHKQQIQQQISAADVWLNSACKSASQSRITQEPENGESTSFDETLLTAECVGDKKAAFLSQTATPNNTPFVLSPPKSPEPFILEEEMSLRSFRGSEDMLNTNETSVSANSEFTSVCSSESEAEFVVVPLPECFVFDADQVVESRDIRSNSDSSVKFIGSDCDDILLDCSIDDDDDDDADIHGDHCYAKSAPLDNSPLEHETNNFTDVTVASRVSSETGEINYELAQEDSLPPMHESFAGDSDGAVGGDERTEVLTKAEDFFDSASTVNVLPEGLISAAALLFNSARTAFDSMKRISSPEDRGKTYGGDVAANLPNEVSSDLRPILTEMGFKDQLKNDRLTAKHDGNLEKILDELIKQDDKDWFNHRH